MRSSEDRNKPRASIRQKHMRSVKTLLVIVACGSATRLPACCMSYGARPITLARETALIIWDAEKGVEHFIRKAEFTGDAADFGFIFPSPTQPFRLAEANDAAFYWLEALRPYDRFSDSKSEDSKAGGIEILEEREVGDFDATVLRATDGRAMAAWLKKNGHRLRPAMTPWFDHYAKRQWVFTALKYKGRRGAIPTKALCISFKTEKPHYPYKMPSDTWGAEHFRPLDLYVLSKTEMSGHHTGGEAWPAERSWTTEVPAAERDRLERTLVMDRKALDLPKNLVLTRFQNTPAARRYDQDVVFSRAAHSVVTKSPFSGETESPSVWPYWAVGLGAVGAFAGYRAFRYRR